MPQYQNMFQYLDSQSAAPPKFEFSKKSSIAVEESEDLNLPYIDEELIKKKNRYLINHSNSELVEILDEKI